MKNLDLVILAGGKGSRIKKYLNKRPKPMMKFNKVYFLQYLLNNFCKFPFKNVYILTGYRSDIIFKNFHNKTCNFTKVICIKEKKLMGTGGALLSLKRKKINNFILTNGDTIFDIDLKVFLKSYKKNKMGCVALASNSQNINNIKLNNLGLKKNVLEYKRKSKLMNGGVYYFNKKILNILPKKNSSLEEDILPNLIKKNLITGKYFKNFFLDIGTPNYLKIAEKKLNFYFKKPAAFFDRDGVINFDYGYVHKKRDFKFRKGVIKGLKYLIKKKYYIFIVTNQAGIGKGFFTQREFQNLHIFLKEYLYKKDIFLNDVQFSPFHPNAKLIKYRKKSNLRKPGNQMVKNIFTSWLIEKNKSFMIGDKKTDFKTAKKSNLYFEFAKEDFYKQIKKIIKD